MGMNKKPSRAPAKAGRRVPTTAAPLQDTTGTDVLNMLQEAAAHVEDDVTNASICSSCRVAKAPDEMAASGSAASMRCRDCNRLQVRMSRVRSSTPQLAADWNTMDDHVKKEFMASCKELHGEALKDAMMTTIRIHRKNTTEVWGDTAGG